LDAKTAPQGVTIASEFTHWARLRKAKVDPRRVVAAWLAVEAVIANDPAPVTKREFKQVQAAKIVHRLASGTHKIWRQQGTDVRGQPVIRTVELHTYPHSRGRVLRHIGKSVEGTVELLLDQHPHVLKHLNGE
jgi:hypothetical protein